MANIIRPENQAAAPPLVVAEVVEPQHLVQPLDAPPVQRLVAPQRAPIRERVRANREICVVHAWDRVREPGQCVECQEYFPHFLFRCDFCAERRCAGCSIYGF